MPSTFERFEKRILDGFDRWQLGAVARLGRAHFWLETHPPEEIVYPFLLIKPTVDIFVSRLEQVMKQVPQRVDSGLFQSVNHAISIAASNVIVDEQTKLIVWAMEHIEQDIRSKSGPTQKARYARWFTAEMMKALVGKSDRVKSVEIGEALRVTASGLFFAGADMSESLGAHGASRESKERVSRAVRATSTNRKELFEELNRFVDVPALI